MKNLFKNECETHINIPEHALFIYSFNGIHYIKLESKKMLYFLIHVTTLIKIFLTFFNLLIFHHYNFEC
jgi:hypothetical protein